MEMIIMEILENVNEDNDENAGDYVTFERWRIKVTLSLSMLRADNHLLANVAKKSRLTINFL